VYNAIKRRRQAGNPKELPYSPNWHIAAAHLPQTLLSAPLHNTVATGHYKKDKMTQTMEERREHQRNYARVYRASHPEESRASKRASMKRAYAANPKKYRLRARRWATTHPKELKISKHKEYVKHKARYRAQGKQYYTDHIEEVKARGHRYRIKNFKKLQIQNKQYLIAHPEKNKVSGEKFRLGQQILVFDHYGHRCTWCGETNPLFLQLDHIHCDGFQHRRNAPNGSWIYGWIIKNNYPKGILQVLCANCHLAKTRRERRTIERPITAAMVFGTARARQMAGRNGIT
jgi:hypothetical protein